MKLCAAPDDKTGAGLTLFPREIRMNLLHRTSLAVAACLVAGAGFAQEQSFAGAYKATMTPELSARLKKADLAAV